jgi:hypothetical protein
MLGTLVPDPDARLGSPCIVLTVAIAIVPMRIIFSIRFRGMFGLKKSKNKRRKSWQLEGKITKNEKKIGSPGTKGEQRWPEVRPTPDGGEPETLAGLFPWGSLSWWDTIVKNDTGRTSDG